MCSPAITRRQAVNAQIKAFNESVASGAIPAGIINEAQRTVDMANERSKLTVELVQQIAGIILAQDGDMKRMRHELSKMQSQLGYRQ